MKWIWSWSIVLTACDRWSPTTTWYVGARGAEQRQHHIGPLRLRSFPLINHVPRPPEMTSPPSAWRRCTSIASNRRLACRRYWFDRSVSARATTLRHTMHPWTGWLASSSLLVTVHVSAAQWRWRAWVWRQTGVRTHHVVRYITYWWLNETSVFLLSSATCSTHALGERDGSINSPLLVHAMLHDDAQPQQRRLMQIYA